MSTMNLLLFKLHADGTHNNATQKPARAENVRRPSISMGGTSEEWQYFLTRWDDYKIATKIAGVDLVIQLLECCEEDLRKDLTRSAGGSLTNNAEEDVLRKMKALAVRQENIMVARVELQDMHQDIDEGIRSFSARVKGQANVCRYILSCPTCSSDVNYTDEIMKDIIVKGISDSEIQLDIISDRNQNMSLEDIMRYVEAKEAGKRSASKIMGNTQNACGSRSTYKKALKIKPTNETACSFCGKSGHGKSAPVNTRKKQCQAYGKTCSHCGLSNHFASVCRMKAYGLTKVKSSPIEKDPETTSECAIWQELCSVHTNRDAKRTIKHLSHHVYHNFVDKWVQQPSLQQPMVSLLASTNADDYRHLGFRLNVKPACIKITAVPDTGCQSCLAGLNFFNQLGLSRSQLIPVNLRMTAANRSLINIVGAAIVNFSSKDQTGRVVGTKQIVYATDATNRIYLSREACIALKIISEKFPLVGEIAAPVCTDKAVSLASIGTTANCGCPKRSLPPTDSYKLPFSLKSTKDVQQMKEWLLQRYKSSTFNTCTHQTLPHMKGPPLRLMIDPSAEPDPEHTPFDVPIRWMDAVKEGLDQDVRLGVIRPVPVGKPVTWCHGMVAKWQTKTHGGLSGIE